MSTRHLTAYGMIAAIAAAGFIWLWFSVLRHRFAARRGRARSRLARQNAQTRMSA